MWAGIGTSTAHAAPDSPAAPLPAVAAAAPVVPVQSAGALADSYSRHPKLDKTAAAAKAGTTMSAHYAFGGGHGSRPNTSPSGTDCSGYVRWAYAQGFGIDIGSASGDAMIRTSGKFTRVSTPTPGDVVLFGRGGRAPAYHAGIYIGTNAAGQPLMAHNNQTGTDAHINTWVNRYSAGDFIGYYHLTAVADPPNARPTSITAKVSSGNVKPGNRFTISGTLSSGGSRLSGKPVQLFQRVNGGKWTLRAHSGTVKGGRYTFRLGADASGHEFYVKYPGSGKPYQASKSGKFRQNVYFSLNGITSIPAVVPAKSRVTVSGSTHSILRGKTVYLQRVTPKGWVNISAGVISSNGTYKFRFLTGSAGNRGLRLVVPGSSPANRASSHSPYRVVRVG